MSKLKLPINYKSLELELQESLKADELYKLQNDAKLRAMEQNVPTYEDFRQMVSAAHLKPLNCNGVKTKINKSWNPLVR
ncbi:dynein axonemal assembly factor 19 [Xylocopa sonorina]|uniref:dynein axonemal assembly factor 19 n=1 Tax=Xylocopa sonorina TaxID=1818115 RepID=UPI00403AE25C